MQIGSDTAVIVTGGVSGLGLATALALKAQGAKVAIFDVDAQRGVEVAETHGLTFCHVDVTSDESVADGFAHARAAQGQERVLVNCAGIGPAAKTVGRDRATGAVKTFPMETFVQTIEVNLVGTFRCIASAAAGMVTLDPVDGERGVIINTASVAAEDGQVGQAAYAASKGGVVGLTLPVARDLSRDLIRVNTILPGLFRTPLLMGLPDEVQTSLGAQVPNPARLGDPGEYASLALEMIRNGYFNAAKVRLDGAIRMAPR
ncbi:MAG: SDR family NAD(P)-dependent oxidoreductase [Pseudomonadota bacterium]